MAAQVERASDAPRPSRRAVHVAADYPLASWTDEQLAAACASGSEAAQMAAWGILYPRAKQQLIALARMIRNEPDLADDLVQETLVKAWAHREAFDPSKATYMSWVRTILHRCYHSAVRKEVVRSATAAIEARMDGGVGSWYGTPYEDLDDRAHAATVRDRLRPLLERLRPEERELLLIWADGGSTDEWAQANAKNAATARSWLHRAQRRLRHAYVTTYGELSTEAL